MQNEDIYNYINITNVVNQLGLKKTYKKGIYLYAICPFCQKEDEKNGYLKINTASNVYICKNCEESGSSIDLYSNITFMPRKEAFKRLLQETPILDNMQYTYNNPIKDECYRDFVYKSFLELQSLNDKHYKKLKTMNFNDEYIKQNQFKSIETNEYKKKEICKRLKAQGIKLDRMSWLFSRY